MRSFHNIEKSGFHARQYVGYSADGRSWKITGSTGYWTARANLTKQGSLNILIGFERLSELSEELQQIKED